MQYAAGIDARAFCAAYVVARRTPISTNLYLRGGEEGNFRAIRQLPKARLRASTDAACSGDLWHLTTRLQNLSPHPALMVKLTVVREQGGDRILPAIYNDNYFTLLPGEQRTIQTELNHADTREQRPRMLVRGFNVETTPA